MRSVLLNDPAEPPVTDTAARCEVSVVLPCLNEAGTVGTCVTKGLEARRCRSGHRVAPARYPPHDAEVEDELYYYVGEAEDGPQLHRRAGPSAPAHGWPEASSWINVATNRGCSMGKKCV